MSLLTRDERRTLTDYLLRLPNIGDAAARRLLLADLPSNLRDGIDFANAPAIHIANILNQVDSDAWEVLPDGSRPLFTVIENAADMVRGARLESDLRTLLGTLRARAGGGSAPLNPAPGPAGQGAASKGQHPADLTLSGSQQRQFQEALLSAFPNYGDLERMVRFGLDQSLAAITSAGPLGQVIFELIGWSAAQGNLSALVTAATTANPNNPKLRAFVGSLAQPPAAPAAPVQNQQLQAEPPAAHTQPATPQDGFRYDAFISYSNQDKSWVRKTLVPRLESAALRVCAEYRDFELGAPRLVNIENAIQRSRKTLLVLTPAWVASEWNGFAALLAQTLDPAAQRRRLLLLLLEPCELPARLAEMFSPLDLTDAEEFDYQMERLVTDIRTTSGS